MFLYFSSYINLSYSILTLNIYHLITCNGIFKSKINMPANALRYPMTLPMSIYMTTNSNGPVMTNIMYMDWSSKNFKSLVAKLMICPVVCHNTAAVFNLNIFLCIHDNKVCLIFSPPNAPFLF